MALQDTLKQSPKQIQNSDQCLLYGAFVRGARCFLGLSQDEFAKMIGVERTTLLRLEKGESPLKSSLCQSAVEVLAKAGIASNDLLDLRDSASTPNTIVVSLDFEHLSKNFFGLTKSADIEEKMQALLGLGYRPPLSEQPLRVKKTDKKGLA